MPGEPKIVAFVCTWCTYTGADLAGISRLKYKPNVRVIRFMCSGRIDAQFILKALAEGADGVLISGCHPNDCHYQEGNYKALRRVHLLQRLLEQYNINPERLMLTWVSASEGEKWQQTVNEFTAKIRNLGPLKLEEPTPVELQEAAR